VRFSNPCEIRFPETDRTRTGHDAGEAARSPREENTMATRVNRWIGLLLALGMVAAWAGLSAAQEATPADTAAHEDHPAHIHTGTCATLGDVAYPLEDVRHQPPVATPQASGSGAENADASSTTVVEASLDDILADEHALNVHESAEAIDVYIACGDVTGSPTDGTLVIALEELNASGYSGEATLVDNGDGTTSVAVSIIQVAAAATPIATPAG
jgi:hypothetical protein